ncbi:MAG TPA: zinc-dependent alcohol dehydrogenase family protein [Polyangiaceae bacterium]
MGTAPQSMVLHAPGPASSRPLGLEARPTRAPGAGEVLLQVTACGVCRTDLQIAEGDLKARRLPIVPGHQIVGRVVTVGEGVTEVRTGQRVGVGWLASACGTCRFCQSGRENLCPHAKFTGWDVDGGYATHAVARASATFAIPDSFGDLDAAPLLCGGIIGYRSLRRSRIEPGQRLGLFGFGASALIAIQIARHWGCRVFVYTRSDEERERARQLGAEWAGGYDDPPPERLDAAVTFAPSGDVVLAALRACDRGATVAINAIHLDRIPEFSYDDLWLERSLASVANYTHDDAREFLALAAEIPVRTTIDVFDLRDANTALERLSAGKVRGAAVLRVE